MSVITRPVFLQRAAAPPRHAPRPGQLLAPVLAFAAKSLLFAALAWLLLAAPAFLFG